MNMIDITSSPARDYALVKQTLAFIKENWREQPTLETIAEQAGLSPHHLQRLFTRWAGISPKRFVQYLTATHAKQLLANAHSVLDTAYETGLSGPGRLHDLLVAVEAMTPGEFKTRGAGLVIRYGRHATPFGDCILAASERGVCKLSFLNGEGNFPHRCISSFRRFKTYRNIIDTNCC